MQENEFEKQLHKLMEDFKISPSDTVWDKVEEQIPKQKSRRRWMILFFLFAGLLVSGYFIYNNYSSSGKTTIALKNQNSKQEKNSNTNQANKELNNSSQNNVSTKPAQAENSITSTKKSRQQTISANSQPLTKINKEQGRGAIHTSTESDDIAAEKNQVTSSNVKTEKNIVSDTLSKSEIVLNTEQKWVDTLSKKNIDSSHSIAAAKKESKVNNNKKWNFGITAFYGRSDVSENYKNAHATGSNSTIGGYIGDSLKGTGNPKAKGAFSFGVVIKKELNSKSNLTFGVQYLKLQTEIETGTLKDSAATFSYNNLAAAPSRSLDNYYQSGSGMPHINSYSFVQIPVAYERELLKNKSLKWNAGFTLNRLISSDALVYDSYHHAYYNNNDLYRKTQVTLVGGITTHFRLGGNTSVNLGPQVQYGVTNLFKNNNYGSQHLFTYGLQANIYFKK